MDQQRPSRVQENVYAGVYHVLLGGMLASTVLFIFGLVRAILLHTYFPLTPDWIKQHYHWYAVTSGLATLEPTTLMMVATVLLILTPVVRVIVSIYVFAVDHDRKYVLVTSIVLSVMILTFVLSRFGLQ